MSNDGPSGPQAPPHTAGALFGVAYPTIGSSPQPTSAPPPFPAPAPPHPTPTPTAPPPPTNAVTGAAHSSSDPEGSREEKTGDPGGSHEEKETPAAAMPPETNVSGDQEAAGVGGEASNTRLPPEDLDRAYGLIQGASLATEEDRALTIKHMCDLRLQLLSHGEPAQVQVCGHPLYATVCDLVACAHAKIVEAACRILCTLAAKNARTTGVVIGTHGIVNRFFEVTLQSAEHVSTACALCAVPCASGEPTPGVFSLNPCPLSAMACGAMWALCALCMKNPAFQASFVSNAPVVSAVITHLSSVCEEAVSSAAWLLCNAVMNTPSLSLALYGMGVTAPLVRVLADGPPTAKGLAAWAVRSLVVDNKTIQEAFVSEGVVPHLVKLMASDVAATQASAVWALGTLCSGVVSIQDRLRVEADGAALQAVVDLLASSSPQVQMQAAASLYNIAARSPDNQDFLGRIGAVERLTAMLPKTQGSVKSVEKAIAALLSLALKHGVNQKRIAGVPGFPFQLVRYLGCPVPRIQGLAAGLVRTLVADQPDLQTLFVAQGSFAYLLDLAQSKDHFAQEQAVAAMYNLIAQQPSNKAFLMCMEPEVPLATLLSDCTKPTRLAYTCAVMVLFALADGNDAYTGKLASMRDIVDAALRLGHPACGDARLRVQAERLLRTLDVSAYESRATMAPVAVLAALPTWTNGEGRARFECAVCMSDAPTTFLSLPCFHHFHLDCMQQWVRTGKDSCPTCKNPVLRTVLGMLGGDVSNLPGATAADGSHPGA